MNFISNEDVMTNLAVEYLLKKESFFLDTQEWDSWLDLYSKDCEYWVPAWKSEHLPTDNPQTETSLIYYSSRAGLEDRVWRVGSGQSIASRPLPRTLHSVGNILVQSSRQVDGHTLIGFTYNWTVHQFVHKQSAHQVFFGRNEGVIRRDADQFSFTKKRILLLNDYIPTKIDFYNLG